MEPMLTDNLLLLLVRDLVVVYCKVSNASVLFRFELTFLPVTAIKLALRLEESHVLTL